MHSSFEFLTSNITVSGLELQYLLDAKKQGKTKRMFFLKNEGLSSRNKTIVLKKGREWRDSFTVYVPGAGIHDKLTSLDVQVHYSLTGQASGYSGSRFRRELNPVLGQFETMSSDSVSIQKNCGKDNLCIPDLSLEAN
jgi:integrin alpha 8